MMSQAVKGKSVDEAHALFERFHSMVTTPPAVRNARATSGRVTSSTS